MITSLLDDHYCVNVHFNWYNWNHIHLNRTSSSNQWDLLVRLCRNKPPEFSSFKQEQLSILALSHLDLLNYQGEREQRWYTAYWETGKVWNVTNVRRRTQILYERLRVWGHIQALHWLWNQARPSGECKLIRVFEHYEKQRFSCDHALLWLDICASHESLKLNITLKPQMHMVRKSLRPKDDVELAVVLSDLIRWDE